MSDLGSIEIDGIRHKVVQWTIDRTSAAGRAGFKWITTCGLVVLMEDARTPKPPNCIACLVSPDYDGKDWV